MARTPNTLMGPYKAAPRPKITREVNHCEKTEMHFRVTNQQRISVAKGREILPKISMPTWNLFLVIIFLYNFKNCSIVKPLIYYMHM